MLKLFYKASSLFFLFFCFTGISPSQLRNPISPIIRCQQLIHGPSVLVVSLNPGDEDFDGLAQIRISSGARISFLHVTNGESIPSNQWPWASDLVKAQRKEEALQSARVFDGNAYFLNIPDRISDSVEFLRQWQMDTLAAKIALVIHQVKPHIILLCSGKISQKETRKLQYTKKTIVLASNFLANQMSSTVGKHNPWQIQCIAMTKPGSVLQKGYFLTDRKNDDPESKLLAMKARACYKSLSFQEQQGKEKRDEYLILQTANRSKANSLIERIHIATSELGSVEKAVHDAGMSLLKKEATSTQKVTSTLDKISVSLQKGLRRYSEVDQRAMILWKGDLDYFQARESEKYFDISVSDSILTNRQVFFVEVKLLNPELRRGKTQILFQKEKKDDWVINESLKRVFDLAHDSLFRILTPENLTYTTPTAIFGLDQLTLDEPFRFSIVHQGATESESMILSKEVLLRYCPRHASVIQTPIIPITEKSSLIIDSYNYSRDPVDGIFFVKDSICWSDTIRFSLNQKDQGRRDTISLHWAVGLSDSEYSVNIHGSTRTIGSFIGRKIPLPPSRRIRVYLVSDRINSPLEEYFQIIGVSVKKIASKQISERDIAETEVLVIDRDTQLEDQNKGGVIDRWIHEGGRLVVLPQSHAMKQMTILKNNFDFLSIPPIKVNTLTATGDYQEYLRRSDAVIDGIIHCSTPLSFEELATTEDGKIVLAGKKEGKGMMIVSALDLDMWIAQVDPAGYGILNKLMFSH
jgi:hypothetical protein